VRALVDVAFVSHHLTPERHRCVLELAPQLGVAGRTERISRAAAKIVESALNRHAAEIAPGIDLPTAAQMIGTTLEALAHRVLQPGAGPGKAEAPEAALAAVRRGQLAEEAARMISRYLTCGR
jgi:hypothetical protein